MNSFCYFFKEKKKKLNLFYIFAIVYGKWRYTLNESGIFAYVIKEMKNKENQ